MTAPHMTAPIAPTSAADLATVKARQQAAWSSGDYAVIGTTLQIVGENLAEAADLNWDEDVLDIAAGNGNATLAAARRGSRVVSTDYVPRLLEQGAARAKAEALQPTFQVADAESLPFAGATFDVAISTFGVMFAPDHQKCASEMLRVVKPGGRIALANWTPASLVGQMFRILGKHVAPPAGVKSPALWGTPEHLQALFGHAADSIHVVERRFNFRYRSALHFVETFRTWYGPVHKAFASLAPDAAATLERDLVLLIDSCNIGARSALLAPSEYLEVVIRRK